MANVLYEIIIAIVPFSEIFDMDLSIANIIFFHIFWGEIF